MFFIISKLLAFTTKPIIWITALLISGVFIKKRRKIVILLSTFLLYLFSNSFICDEISKLWEVKHKNVADIKQVYDVGIVLGGMSEYDRRYDMLNFNEQADRLIFAEQLYHLGVIKKILISGGSGQLINNNYFEAQKLQRHLIKNGIPKKDIIVEYSSRNTKENAIRSSRILKQRFSNGNFLLITSAIHMKRSVYCFKKVGVNTTPFPTDNTNSNEDYTVDYLIFPHAETFKKWETIIHEWIGYIVYKITF